MGVAKDERNRLAELFTEVGPDAPTLCDGWQTRDLAAHLVVRDRRLDAAPGILFKPLAGYTARVQRGYSAKPWAELVQLVRAGAPWYSPMSIGAVDELVNSTEFFVHLEDVRRAVPGWSPRPADPVLDEQLWKALGRIGKMSLRGSPVGIELRRADGASIVARRGPDTVTVTGAPGELVLFAFGRDEARLEFSGEQAAISRVKGLKRGL